MATLRLTTRKPSRLWAAMNREMDEDWFADICALVINFNSKHADKLQITLNEKDPLSSSLFSYADGGFSRRFPRHVRSLRIQYKNFDQEFSPDSVTKFTRKISSYCWLPRDHAKGHSYVTCDKEFEEIKVDLPDDDDLLKIINTVFCFIWVDCEVCKNNEEFDLKVEGGISQLNLSSIDDMKEETDECNPRLLTGKVIEIDRQEKTFTLEVRTFKYCLKIHFSPNLLDSESFESLEVNSSVRISVSQISGKKYLLSVKQKNPYY